MSDILLLAIIAFIPPLAALPPTIAALANFRQIRAMKEELEAARAEIIALKLLLADRLSSGPSDDLGITGQA